MWFVKWLADGWQDADPDELDDVFTPKKMTAAEINAAMGADNDDDDDQ